MQPVPGVFQPISPAAAPPLHLCYTLATTYPSMATTVKFNTSDTSFFRVLRSRTDAYFKDRQISPTGNAELYSKTIILFCVFLCCYITLVFFTPASGLISLGLCGLLGFCLAVMGFNIMHDGAHGSYSRSRRVNELMALTLNFMGGNADLWKQKHNVNHHTYTNVEGIDDDIDVKPLMRMHADQKKLWVHRFQHYYALLLYGLTYLSWIFIVDFQKYFSGKTTPSTPLPKMNMAQHFNFWVSKLVHYTIFLFIPFFMVGVLTTIIGYLVMAIVTGLVIAVTFQLAHVVQETQFVAPPEGQTLQLENNWALHQLQSTANFGTGSKALNWLLGGLNFQVEHHLFPRISHVHYPHINKILRQTCKEYGVVYHEFPSMFSALRSHLLHLKNVGRLA
jgi:linoleoyl-CoA desaturase